MFAYRRFLGFLALLPRRTAMAVSITDLVDPDIRFPTSRTLDGSDAMNVDPDYSAAYVVLKTDSQDGLEGHGLTFTCGRGNEVCVAAIQGLKHHVVGKSLDSITPAMAKFWRALTQDSQLRWLGPEKGVIHLATAAVVNAVWDLYAKAEGKPVWKLVVDMTRAEFVRCVAFRYITDAIRPDGALEVLRRLDPAKRERGAEWRPTGARPYRTP